MALDLATDGRDWPLREHSRMVTHGGMRWHVQTVGRGPALLLLHGTGASTHSFRALVPLLARTHTVVAPDLPGHGFSSAPARFAPSLEGTARALGSLVEALGIRPALAVGHSAGAALLVRMTLDGSIAPARLVSLAGALVPFRGVATALFSPAARLLARSPLAPALLARRARDRANIERLVAGTGSRLDATGVSYYQRLASSGPHVAAVLRMLAAWDLEPLFATLPRLRTELLLVVGANDRAVPPAQAWVVEARVPGARVVVVPGTGHLVHEEAPARVAELVLEGFKDAVHA